ncbi:MAG: hypothetical protein LJE69_11590 [Thiohalocapsa sp.]|uniref:hypothetical protein n=1 Tax=Thiohalocapsa sp. TaxID=2497641 RepID=UPI0025DD0FF1|nr:hypothetical protein [Thiohalocapsa sp.]MCG6941878.1 hypothetical protein [Thiohalocapsa sp.]
MLAHRWLVNLALLAVLALLILAAQLDKREELRRTRLTALAPDEVMDIELYRAGEPAVRLRREDDRWQMLAPFAVAASDDAVAKLLPVAQAQVWRTLPAAGLDLAELGLEPAPVRILLNGLELRFGGTEPVAAQRYVQVGDMVHLIDDRFLPRLMTPTIELVSRRLLPAGFSPGLGDLDGTPLTAGALAPLADVEAVRVETPKTALDDALAGRLLHVGSEDGGDGLDFLVSDGGTRWTRLDAELSWLFAAPPLDAVRDWPAPGRRGTTKPAQTPPDQRVGTASPPRQISIPARNTPAQRPAPAPAVDAVRAMPSPPGSPSAPPNPATHPLPIERVAPPAPGTEPVEQRPTAAIPNLRDLAPARPPDRSALPRDGSDPFAPAQDMPPTLPANGEPEIPLRTEKLHP